MLRGSAIRDRYFDRTRINSIVGEEIQPRRPKTVEKSIFAFLKTKTCFRGTVGTPQFLFLFEGVLVLEQDQASIESSRSFLSRGELSRSDIAIRGAWKEVSSFLGR